MSSRPYIPRSGERAQPHARYPSSRKAELKIWWREVDRVLIGLVLGLMAIGAAAVFAASPASAHRLSTKGVKLPELYFYWAHLRWQLLGLVVLIGASTLSRENARRVGIVLAATMEEVGERYTEVMVPLDKVGAANALAPIDQRTVFGKAVMLFDGVSRAQLAQLGETRNPSVADLFVATMKGTYA